MIFFLIKAIFLLTLSIVAKIDAVQAEYSAFETLHETDGLIAACKELGVAYVAYSPLGHGWLVDNFDYKSPDDFAPDDFRRKGMFYLPTWCIGTGRFNAIFPFFFFPN